METPTVLSERDRATHPARRGSFLLAQVSLGLLALGLLASCGEPSRTVSSASPDCSASAAPSKPVEGEDSDKPTIEAAPPPPRFPRPEPRSQGPVRRGADPVLVPDQEPPEDAIAAIEEKRCLKKQDRLRGATTPLPEQREDARATSLRKDDVAVIVSLREPIPWDLLQTRLQTPSAQSIVPDISHLTAYLELDDGYPVAAHGEFGSDLRRRIRETLEVLRLREVQRGNVARLTSIEQALANVDQQVVLVGVRLSPSVVSDDFTTRANIEHIFGPTMVEVSSDPTKRALNFREGRLRSGDVDALREYWEERR